MPPTPYTISLLHCPEEILCDIVQLTSPLALSALSLVGKRLNRVVEPLLYSKVEWEWKAETIPPIQLLLRSILERPELGTRVQCLILKGWTSSWRGNPPKIPVDRVGLLSKAISAVKRTGVAHSDLWIRELASGTMDAFVALLLSQLPELTNISLGHNFFKESRLVSLMFRSSLCGHGGNNLPKFEHLQEVTWRSGIDFNLENRIPNTVDALTFFYLPNVGRIKGNIENPATFTWPAGIPDPSRLTTLHLDRVREPLLNQLLSVTRGLKSLRWTWYYAANWSSHDPIFDCPIIDLEQFCLAISHVRATLTDLVIEGTCNIGRGDLEPPELEIRGCMAGLAQCDNLVKLEAPLPFLMGSFSLNENKRLDDNLPINLEYLGITDDFDMHEQNEWEGDVLLSLVRQWLDNEHWRQITPCLRGLSLVVRGPVNDAYDKIGDWNRPIRQAVEETCVQAGVLYELIAGV